MEYTITDLKMYLESKIEYCKKDKLIAINNNETLKSNFYQLLIDEYNVVLEKARMISE